VVRPAVLTAFLGYLLFIVGLMFDLGRPWYIWHQLIYRNPHSVMFEVGMCVMTYTTVLFFEFLPNVFERLNWKTPIKWIKKIYPILIVLGILLSTLHQSSLGSLYLIMPSKLHPFWYTPALPFFFFASAVAVGLAMTIFESTQSARPSAVSWNFRFWSPWAAPCWWRSGSIACCSASRITSTAAC
jgi:Ni/Fe-hydrogenase subunit HybB-like protein